ncbi:major capsid protein [Aeromonas hydrophila]|uniref:major capsid protein n=1 Tax=Aeromonas hydrophila TaxID=644 RepID=UPI000F52C82F|nr:major capsid protein [Aeromonas hydrophila]RQM72394.1 phage coat protein [Aeromonas hydrophila]
MSKATQLLKKLGATAVIATASVPAFAAEGDIDVSGLLTTIGKVVVAAGLVGVAILSAYGAIKGYKMIRAAM